MPYKVIGKSVLHMKNGRWSIKQMAKSHENAIKAMVLLKGIEHNPSFAKKIRNKSKKAKR